MLLLNPIALRITRLPLHLQNERRGKIDSSRAFSTSQDNSITLGVFDVLRTTQVVTLNFDFLIFINYASNGVWINLLQQSLFFFLIISLHLLISNNKGEKKEIRTYYYT